MFFNSHLNTSFPILTPHAYAAEVLGRSTIGMSDRGTLQVRQLNLRGEHLSVISQSYLVRIKLKICLIPADA